MASMHPAPRHVFATLCAAIALSPGAAIAEDPEGFDDGWQPEDPLPAYSTRFNGSFTGVGARYGLARGDAPGRTLDVGARFAFPFYVGDVRAAYQTSGIESPSARARTHGGQLNLAFHPLFLVLLGSEWLGYTLASFYVDAGLGAHTGRVTPVEGTPWRGRGVSFHAGLGIDIPLVDPDRGQGPWLNLSWRGQRGRLSGEADEEVRLDARTLHVGIAWRFNRLPF